jgi:hypothetical protein
LGFTKTNSHSNCDYKQLTFNNDDDDDNNNNNNNNNKNNNNNYFSVQRYAFLSAIFLVLVSPPGQLWDGS